jgi:hypothetical protein
MAVAGRKPWYRETWLWVVLAPLIVVVLASFATLIIAGRAPPLVVDDFGRIAMTVEREQQRDLRATALGLAAELRFEPAADAALERVEVRLTGDAPESLQLDLVHPTRDERDASAVLRREGTAWRGEIARPAGRRYLQLADADGGWRLAGERAAGQGVVELRAAPVR